MASGIARILAPSGTLRAAINCSNVLLVNGRGDGGKPRGLAPEFAKKLAQSLGVSLQLVPYDNPGLLADAASKNEWDVGFIAAEQERANTISFSQPWAEIEATYLVRSSSRFQRLLDVDQAGVTIAASRRSAYELWLSENLQKAKLIKTSKPGLGASVELFCDQECDVLAGLRPWLLDKKSDLAYNVNGPCRVLDESFHSVKQAIGTPLIRFDADAKKWLDFFVEEARTSGEIDKLIDIHELRGRVSVAKEKTENVIDLDLKHLAE